ncbi:segregation/condensation protein A, partial [Gluconacetobacter azotocaptans]
ALLRAAAARCDDSLRGSRDRALLLLAGEGLTPALLAAPGRRSPSPSARWTMPSDPDAVWETPARRPGIPELHLQGYDGPLDLLLDLAERQHIDLGVMSVAALADQFAAGFAAAQHQVPLAQRAEWVIWAARLVLLRARLMFAAPEEQAAAEQEAQRTAAQLEELLRMRAAADWLTRRPQLGQEVFARPADPQEPAGARRAGSYFDLVAACLTVIEHGAAEAAPAALQVRSLALWSVSAALARIRAVLESGKAGQGWQQFLPALPDGPDLALRRRAALAGTFVAALELARAGEVDLDALTP